MGKLGKKARKFAKKNLQSADKRNRKVLKPIQKKKFAKKNERKEGVHGEVKKVEQKKIKRLPEEYLQNIPIDSIFDKDNNDKLLSGVGDSDNDDYLSEDSTNGAIPSVLTESLLTSYCNLINDDDENQSVQALTSLLNWYRAACHYRHDETTKYEIEDSETFAKVVTFMLQRGDNTFRTIMGLSESTNKEKILKLEKNNAKWDSLKPLVKSFLTSSMHLVEKAADLEIIVFALTQLRVSIVFFTAFPDLLKKLIKISINLWVTGEETLSQQAFLTLKEISKVFNSECFDTCLINMFKAYLQDCETPKENSYRRDSLVELCSQNMLKSYTKAFVSITHLAKLLKMAITTKNKEAVEKIHSEQYTNCVDLWVNFIATNVQDFDLQPLLYTIVQLINGVATLFIGPRYLLLRIKCIQWMNHLSRTSGIFIPIVSLVLDMLEYNQTTSESEKQKKKLESVSTVKLPKNFLKSQNFQDQCVVSVIELLAVHFSQWSFHISFPELATIPVMRLMKFIEGSTKEGLNRQVKRFIEQVELNIEFVRRTRDEAAFSPKDKESVEAFLQDEKRNKNASYTQYYQSVIGRTLGTKVKK